MAQFGELLREVREQANKSMGMVARHLGVSVPYLSAVELGRRAPLTNDRIQEVGRFLGLALKRVEALMVKAAESRGFFELEASNNETRQRVGAALARRWSNLEDNELRDIERIIEGYIDESRNSEVP